MRSSTSWDMPTPVSDTAMRTIGGGHFFWLIRAGPAPTQDENGAAWLPAGAGRRRQGGLCVMAFAVPEKPAENNDENGGNDASRC